MQINDAFSPGRKMIDRFHGRHRIGGIRSLDSGTLHQRSEGSETQSALSPGKKLATGLVTDVFGKVG